MARTRERESGMGLLPRMEAIVGKTVTSYRYHPVQGKPIGLGRDRAAAIRRVLDLEGRAPGTGTLRWVWEKYRANKRFLKLAQATRDDYEQCWLAIGPILGGMRMPDITAPVIARYVRVEREDAPSRANHEKALLSNLCAMGIDLGACETNPAKHVRPNDTESHTEAPAPALLAGFLAWVARQTPQRRLIGLAARYASLGGSRKVEFLDLAWPQVDFDAGEIRVKRAKQRGKKRGLVVDVITISRAMRACLDELVVLREPDCLYVFPTRDGRAYTDRGFKTLWQRVMMKAIAEGIVPVDARFTFHDLRAYYATQHKVRLGKLPDLHKNPATTASVYDRNEEVTRRAL